MIPSETQLANLPDRFENLSTPEAPATVMVDDDEEEEAAGDDPDPSAEDEPGSWAIGSAPGLTP